MVIYIKKSHASEFRYYLFFIYLDHCGSVEITSFLKGNKKNSLLNAIIKTCNHTIFHHHRERLRSLFFCDKYFQFNQFDYYEFWNPDP